jgi:hypothetical protein
VTTDNLLLSDTHHDENAACQVKSILPQLIARWSKAVRDHDPDKLIFYVLPPLLSRRLDACMATWQTFFGW